MNGAGKRAFVTGADGFIGSHLVERLVGVGYRVKALAYYNSHQSAGWIDVLEPGIRSELEIVYGDIRDRGFVESAMRGQDLVLHLAALISIPHSYEAPQSFIETNVLGTFNVLEAAKQLSTERLILTSTSEVYGTPESVPITIRHPLHAQSPYAATKIAADQMAIAYAASFGLPVTILRPFNTFGPRQSPRAVITTILAQMIAGREQIKLGSLHPKRDFTFVSDTVEGFVRMAKADLRPGEVVQLGTGRAIAVRDVVDIAARITNWAGRIEADAERVRPEASEVQVLMADPSGAWERIGWCPSVDFEQGLLLTSEWLYRQERMPDVDRFFQ